MIAIVSVLHLQNGSQDRVFGRMPIDGLGAGDGGECPGLWFILWIKVIHNLMSRCFWTEPCSGMFGMQCKKRVLEHWMETAWYSFYGPVYWAVDAIKYL